MDILSCMAMNNRMEKQLKNISDGIGDLFISETEIIGSNNLFPLVSYKKETNGVTVTCENGIVTMEGTWTASFNMSIPITSMTWKREGIWIQIFDVIGDINGYSGFCVKKDSKEVATVKDNNAAGYARSSSVISGDTIELCAKVYPNFSGKVSFKVSLSDKKLDAYESNTSLEKVTTSILKESSLPDRAVLNGNVLYGKKWAVCGDSFSHGDFSNALDTDNTISSGLYKGKNKVYGYLIGNRNNMVIQHLAAGGRTMGLPADHETTGFTNSLVTYYQTIDADVDYITIMLGINDNHHLNGSSGTDGEDVTGVIPIGTLNDTTTDSFCGAYQVILDWLIVNRPNAKIGIIVTNGLPNTTEYRDKTIAIAKKYGIPYIDLNGDERTPAMHRTCNTEIADTVKKILLNKWSVNPGKNTHPSAKAHEYESYFIENFLRCL